MSIKVVDSSAEWLIMSIKVVDSSAEWLIIALIVFLTNFGNLLYTYTFMHRIK